MKFDVIVGNPPYQDTYGSSNKLWKNITKLCYTLSAPGGYIALVTPPSWLSPGSMFKLMTAHDIKWVDLTIGKHFAGVGSAFSAWVVKNAASKGTAQFITESGAETIDWQGMSFLPAVVNATSMSLTRKFFFGDGPRFAMKRRDDFDTRGGHMSQDKTTKYNKIVFHHNDDPWYTNTVDDADYNTPKVLASLCGEQRWIYLPAAVSSQHGVYVTVSNAAEGKRVVKVLSSKLYRAMLQICKYSGWGLFRVIMMLPAVDRSIDWTDEALYKHFGLTKAEIAYVEANAK